MFPIVAALKHHKTTVILVALEIALTCAIVTNALFLIGDRLAAMQVDTGVANGQLVTVTTSGLDLGLPADDTQNTVPADLAALRAIPGVRSAAVINQIPLGGGGFSSVLYRKAGDKHSDVDNVYLYLGTPDIVKTLGLQLSAGRDFRPDEYVDYSPFARKSAVPSAVMVTQALAHELWPGKNPLGKPVYFNATGDKVAHVVGVMSTLVNPGIDKAHGTARSVFLPVRKMSGFLPTIYVLRVAPDARAAVARKVPAVLKRIDPSRTVTARIYTDTVAKYFHGDRSMVWLLVIVIACLLALSALGVVGLSSFWVQGRTKTIGIRRAIGATRRDILRYFMAENFLIVSLGVVIGLAAAVGLNLWLMQHYELHRMPLIWLPAGAVILWVLGQLAVLGPALRASRVPPVVATRSV